ncbi:hypothetical protein RB531_3579 [Salmonella enterica subsp. enterica serovar Typhimurium]
MEDNTQFLCFRELIERESNVSSFSSRTLGLGSALSPSLSSPGSMKNQYSGLPVTADNLFKRSPLATDVPEAHFLTDV